MKQFLGKCLKTANNYNFRKDEVKSCDIFRISPFTNAIIGDISIWFTLKSDEIYSLDYNFKKNNLPRLLQKNVRLSNN